jgi:hypothetical protein
MPSDETRREFLRMLQSAAAIGLFPDIGQAQNVQQGPTPAPLPAPRPTPTSNSSSARGEFLDSASKVIELQMQDMESTNAALHEGLMQELNNFSNGPTISTQSGPAKPYVPGPKGDSDSEPDEGGEEKDWPVFDPNTKMGGTNVFEPSFDSDAY